MIYDLETLRNKIQQLETARDHEAKHWRRMYEKASEDLEAARDLNLATQIQIGEEIARTKAQSAAAQRWHGQWEHLRSELDKLQARPDEVKELGEALAEKVAELDRLRVEHDRWRSGHQAMVAKQAELEDQIRNLKLQRNEFQREARRLQHVVDTYEKIRVRAADWTDSGQVNHSFEELKAERDRIWAAADDGAFGRAATAGIGGEERPRSTPRLRPPLQGTPEAPAASSEQRSDGFNISHRRINEIITEMRRMASLCDGENSDTIMEVLDILEDRIDREIGLAPRPKWMPVRSPIEDAACRDARAVELAAE